jgi:4-diphosphocytidyl-2-C-methyl-D-erythritol kinase
MPDVLTDLAAAKINLFLRVLGQRADGYHRLDSLVGFAEIGDRLTVTASDTLSLTITGPFASALRDIPPEQNLAFRAAEALRLAVGRPDLGAALTLEKHLPIASGIGGGSADAAAALRLLPRLWGIDPARLPLAEIAARLGADVPMCLLSKSACIGGVGEIIAPVGVPRVAAVLVNPGVPVETKAVFAAREGAFSLSLLALPPLTNLDDLADLVQRGGNDLMRPALTLAPVIANVLNALRAAPHCRAAALSGSGATCFGLFPTRDARTEAAARIKTAHPNWWVAGTWLGG